MKGIISTVLICSVYTILAAEATAEPNKPPPPNHPVPHGRSTAAVHHQGGRSMPHAPPAHHGGGGQPHAPSLVKHILPGGGGQRRHRRRRKKGKSTVGVLPVGGKPGDPNPGGDGPPDADGGPGGADPGPDGAGGDDLGSYEDDPAPVAGDASAGGIPVVAAVVAPT